VSQGRVPLSQTESAKDSGHYPSCLLRRCPGCKNLRCGGDKDKWGVSEPGWAAKMKEPPSQPESIPNLGNMG
jgi:hypothetical protein